MLIREYKTKYKCIYNFEINVLNKLKNVLNDITLLKTDYKSCEQSKILKLMKKICVERIKD